MDQTAQLTVPVIQTNVLLVDAPTVKRDGLVITVTRMSMNAMQDIFAAGEHVQTLLVVSTAPAMLLSTV